MKFKIKAIERKLSIKYFIYICFIVMCFEVTAQTKFSASDIALIQSDNQYYKVISFGEKIDFGQVEDSSRWTITYNKQNRVFNLNGNQINDFIFDKPGTYEIIFSENVELDKGKCNHPPFQEKMIIKVNFHKMIFDFSTIKFSENIVGGKALRNIEVSVELDFKSYNHKFEHTVFSNARFIGAGVGVSIIGRSVNDKISLTSGRQKMIYLLNGIASKETYIMLDFFDINGQVQSYYYPIKL